MFSPSNFNDMADDVLNVPPQQSSGVVGSRIHFKDSKKQRNISGIEVQGNYDRNLNGTGRESQMYGEKGMVMQSINN